MTGDTASAPRNLIVFSDGTGNSSAKLFKTNVWRMYDALDLTCSDQLALYDDGVGTASLAPLAVVGGAFGWGLKRNVLDLYCFLARNYRKGDRIFAFGFSRGAFTVRVLTGFIANQGLIQHVEGAELRRQAAWAYRLYREERYKQNYFLMRSLRSLRNGVFATWDRICRRTPYVTAKRMPDVEIEFLGLWDTVDAYGLPFDELTRGWDRWIWPLSLPNQRLWARVRKACHALAIDDERQTFHPRLWDESSDPHVSDSTHIDQERITQVWFAGVHADVGGGYPDDTIAHMPLSWIAREAAARGLRFMPHLCDQGQIPALWKDKSTPCATMHDSRRGAGSYYRYAPRRIDGLRKDIDGNTLVSRPKIHYSVFERIAASPDGYAPIVLPERYAVVDKSGNVLDRENPYEQPAQAHARIQGQEDVWNLVWWRRIVYFVTAACTLLLAVIPIWPGSDRVEILNYALPVMSNAVRLAASVLPSMTQPWLTHYENYPMQLLTGLVIITMLMKIGDSLQQKITDRMRKVWEATRVPRSEPAPVPPTWFVRVRRSPAYFAFFRFFSRDVWPHVFGLAMLFFIIGGFPIAGVRLSFDTASTLGFVCRDDTGPASADGPWTIAFDPTDFCHATGIPIERGTSYRVDILSGSPVRSGESPWFLAAATPLRRVLFAGWHVPVVRVGSTGAEYYPVSQPTTTFTAQRNGRAIMFVNDVILPWPRWDYFYRNNSGGPIQVRIARLPV